jgi:hypothetical protein
VHIGQIDLPSAFDFEELLFGASFVDKPLDDRFDAAPAAALPPYVEIE